MRFSVFLVLVLLLTPFFGICQSYNSFKSDFKNALYSVNAGRYERDVESFINSSSNAGLNADAAALLSVFKLLNDSTPNQAYVCQFNQVMREVGLNYSTVATTNPYLQFLKLKVNGCYVVLLRNTNRQNMYVGLTLGMQRLTEYTIYPYRCAKISSSKKPASYTIFAPKKYQLYPDKAIPCP